MLAAIDTESASACGPAGGGRVPLPGADTERCVALGVCPVSGRPWLHPPRGPARRRPGADGQTEGQRGEMAAAVPDELCSCSAASRHALCV